MYGLRTFGRENVEVRFQEHVPLDRNQSSGKDVLVRYDNAPSVEDDTIAPLTDHPAMTDPSPDGQAPPLDVAVVDKALLVPNHTGPDNQLVGGIFDAARIPIDQRFLKTSSASVVAPTALSRGGLLARGPAIYGGPISAIHGHFILESCARLWFASLRSDLPVVFTGRAALSPREREMLTFLRVENRVVLLTKPTRFAQLFVPQPGFRVPDFFHERYARFMGQCTRLSPDPSRPVWLSRTRLGGAHGHLVNQQEIEIALAQAGWDIIHPQEMTLADQLHKISGINVVAGIEGSALHSVVLLAHPPGRMLVVPRASRPVLQTFQTIADAKGYDQTIVASRNRYTGEGKGYRSRFRAPNPRRVASQLLALAQA